MPSEFDECPDLSYSYRDDLPVEVVQAAGPYYSDRYGLAALSRRFYVWPLKRTAAERKTVDDFLVRARGVMLEAFYLRDPKDANRTAVSLGNGDGAKTVFPLPTTGEESRYYPKNSVPLTVVRVSGVPVTVASVQTDARTITLAAPPGLGAPVEADFVGLRLCRLSSPYDWQGEAPDWYSTSLQIEEVLTD